MHIDFQDNTDEIKEDSIHLIESLLQFAADKENVSSEAEISVSFVNNVEIQELNRNYRDKNEPTDVISFAMQETTEGEVEVNDQDIGIPLLLGDIVISIEKAKEQADEYHHSFERELGFLAVHGFLHLLGYDHMNEQGEKKMFTRQEGILGEFGLER